MPPSPAPDVPPDDDRFAIGSVLDGRYRIDAVLGAGGMGRVYRGEHTGIGRAVAIKVLHANLGGNREAAQRFQREALASGRLDHPNIVGVSDFGVLDGGACYLVMEALDGESLGARLERERRVPWPEAVAILRGVLAGLHHAHERGVVHRDIKPDNVFLARKDGAIVVKILDFGIAKLYAGDANDPASTRAGITVGTPAYLSPEQAVGGEIGPASDLYSATILLFEMITGRAPFEDKDPLAMLGAHVSRPPPHVAEVAPDLAVPAELEDVIRHGLAKLVGDRLASASAYVARLDAIVGPAGVTSAPSLRVPSAEALGVQETEALPIVATPVPGALPTPALPGYATPVPGAPPKPAPPGYATPGYATPGYAPPGYATPVPGAHQPAVATSLVVLPPAPAAAGSRRALVIGGGVIAALVVIAIIAKLASSPPASSGGGGSGAPALVQVPVLIGGERAVDPEIELKALLHDLQNGKTCADRKAAIPRIVELGDPAAIPALKAARYRMRGGVAGFNQDNTNACLTRDAEAAIKKLTPPAK